VQSELTTMLSSIVRYKHTNTLTRPPVAHDSSPAIAIYDDVIVLPLAVYSSNSFSASFGRPALLHAYDCANKMM
jgi:hypothetical protein